MRIGIDYRPILLPTSRRRDIDKFTASLIEHLLQRGGHDFVLYTIGNQRPGLSKRVTWRQLPQIRLPSRLNWLLDRFRWPRPLSRHRSDSGSETLLLPPGCDCP